MMELIERLEAATEGSDELDLAIWIIDRPDLPVYEDKPQCRRPYTTSLDAALTLVPYPWRIYAIQNESFPPNSPKWFAGLDHIPHTTSMIGKAPTPALALCIAALKAIHGTSTLECTSNVT